MSDITVRLRYLKEPCCCCRESFHRLRPDGVELCYPKARITKEMIEASKAKLEPDDFDEAQSKAKR